MRRTIYVDGVEVNLHPPRSIEPQRRPEKNGRQRFESGVKKSGLAFWEYLTGEGDELTRLGKAAQVFASDPDEEKDNAKK